MPGAPRQIQLVLLSPKSFLCFWLAFAIAALGLFAPAFAANTPSADSEYVGRLAEALQLLDAGDCQSASNAVAGALEHRRNERLAYLVRAIVLLRNASYTEASHAFAEAGRMGAEAELVAYGQALCALGQGKLAQAEAALKQQGARATASELRLVRAYVALLRGDKPDLGSLPAEDPRVSLLRAYASLNAGDAGAAVGLLETAAEGPPPSHLLDQGAAMGFHPGAPILCTAVTPITGGEGSGSLSPAGFLGKVRLRADRTKAPGAAYVLFYVDSRLVGIVNTPPYELVWDSATVANGIHTVRIRGEDASGVLVGETSQQVLVANSAPEPGPPLAGAPAETLLDAAWDALRLRGSRTWAEYELAKQAAGEGSRLDAMLRYERILAFQPRYRDVRQRFREVSRWGSGETVWRGSGADRGVALTFDDGPNGGTGSLLDALKECGASATFFLVGSQARRHPELVSRIAAGGHEIACHSESHRSLTDVSEDDLIRELFGPIAAIHEITGAPPRLFRPPGGHFDSRAGKAAADFGLVPVMWSAHCGPYEGGAVRTMEEYTASKVTAGSVVLMHNCEPTTLGALPGIISNLRARGLRPVTVSALRK